MAADDNRSRHDTLVVGLDTGSVGTFIGDEGVECGLFVGTEVAGGDTGTFDVGVGAIGELFLQSAPRNKKKKKGRQNSPPRNVDFELLD